MDGWLMHTTNEQDTLPRQRQRHFQCVAALFRDVPYSIVLVVLGCRPMLWTPRRHGTRTNSGASHLGCGSRRRPSAMRCVLFSRRCRRRRDPRDLQGHHHIMREDGWSACRVQPKPGLFLTQPGTKKGRCAASSGQRGPLHLVSQRKKGPSLF